jgi:hypothetical protein
MADQITISATVNIKGAINDTLNLGQTTTNQSNAGKGGGTQTFNTVEAVVSLANVTTLGRAIVRNLNTNTSNYFSWGPESNSAMVEGDRVYGNSYSIVTLVPGTTYRGKTSTGDMRVDFTVFEL